MRLVFSHAYGRRLIAGVANTFVIQVVDSLICIAPRIPFRRIIFDSGLCAMLPDRLFVSSTTHMSIAV